MEETISLQELLNALRKRMSFIISLTVLTALASGLISYFFLTPLYQASAQILVNQAKSEQQFYHSAEVQTSLQLVNTYSAIIRSPAILNTVAENLDFELTAEQLAQKITVSSEEESQVINLTVVDESQGRAADIANETAVVFQQSVIEVMNVDNVRILSPAEIENFPIPIKPEPILNIFIAAVVGFMVSIGISFWLEYLDNTIKTELDVADKLGLPVLGTVATISESNEEQKKINTLSQKETGGERVGV